MAKTGAHGTIKWFDTAKGFGFLESDGESPVFLHIGSVGGRGESFLKPGAKMEFTLTVGEFGPVATDAKLLK